ncbi:MAG TPA: preprotein translocase subunit YajC [Marmoricola sp.]|nr:preprotein translocase subunit YajC [Marmoricola sp.]
MEFVLIALALVVFWLVVMAPARRQQKKVSNLQHELQVGDEVVISAGIYGTVRSIDDQRVTLEVAPGTSLTVARQVVVRRQEPDATEAHSAPEPRDEAPEQDDPGTVAGTED